MLRLTRLTNLNLILTFGLLTSVLLSSCTSAPINSAASAALFDDAAFSAPSQRIAAEDALAMSPAMKAHLNDVILPKLRHRPTHSGLVDALYMRNGLKLQYDTELTRNAAQAFESRAGNCLSLVLMTAAFATEMGLPVRFQSVYAGETWARDGDLLLFVGHVNIAIGRTPRGLRMADLLADWLTVDFLPTADLQRQRATPIEPVRVVAMYMNNRAAESLARGQVDDAYWWVRGAIDQDGSFSNAWNTLGVVYLRHGQAARADAALRWALQLDSDNPHTMSNLVLALRQQGKADEAQQLALQVQRIQPSTPFGHLELGQQAMREGNFAQARQHFQRAVNSGSDFHEFHFWLAQAMLKLGDHDAATRQLKLAQDTSGSKRLQAMYASKLERLREALVH